MRVALRFDGTLSYAMITLTLFFMELEQLIGKLLALRENFLGQSIVMRFDGIEKLIALYFGH